MDHHHEYHKDMSGSDWAQVFSRQEMRADLFSAWLEALQITPGARVLDVGSGPGYMSLQLAAEVGSGGSVIALDRAAEALDHLAHLQHERRVTNITRVHGDAATANVPPPVLSAALITMVLHHTDDPAGVVHNVARHLSKGGRVVIAEFDPEGPCDVGAPREARLTAVQLRVWCEHAGLQVLEVRQQTPEHYMVVAERA